ncbi:MAG TPA: hypothetical protein VJQ25_06975 [Nitrospira sp.]|jgi:hypothetical protein|nr:hypothetical protein [Nitrospira sp.]
MKRPVMLIAIVLPFLSGCESYKSLLYDNLNPSIGDVKQGQECLPPDPVGLGRTLDLNGGEAMRLGGITKLRRLEYQVVKFHGVGRECVIAHGE